MATRDLGRLAKYVKAHRMEAFSSRAKAAAAAGISKDTWQRVEEGKEVRESTYAKVDRVLGWAVSSCIAVADGGEPVLVDEQAGSGPALLSGKVAAGDVRRAAFEAAMAKLPGAQIGDIQAFSDELVEVLRRAGAVKDGD